MKALITLVSRPLRAALAQHKVALASASMIVHGLSAVLAHANGIADGTTDLDPAALELAIGELVAGGTLIAARYLRRKPAGSTPKEGGK